MDRREFLSVAAFAPAGLFLARAGVYPFEHTGTTSASMWIYLWDLADEGYSAVLTRLKEHGLTSVSLATSYHTGRFLAPHNPKRKIVFPEDGTVYFSPAMHLYGRITPIVNSLVREGHHLRRLKNKADEAGLDTRAWVVCCHNTALGTRYPDVTVENVFGDRMLHSLCPSNRSVRQYLRTLVRDIATTGVSVIELEAFAFPGYSHGFHHERDGIPLSVTARFLLSLCFCPSCLQQSAGTGVHAGALRSGIRQKLEAYFASPDAGREVYDVHRSARAAGPDTSAAGAPGTPAPSGTGQGSVAAGHTGNPPDTSERSREGPGAPGRGSEVDSTLSDESFHNLLKGYLDWRRSTVTDLVRELSAALFPLPTRLRPIVALDHNARRDAGVDAAGIAEITGGVIVPGYVREGESLRSPLSDLIAETNGKEITVGFQVGLPESGGREDFLGRLSVGRAAGITSFNFYNYGLISLDRLPWIREGLTGT